MSAPSLQECTNSHTVSISSALGIGDVNGLKKNRELVTNNGRIGVGGGSGDGSNGRYNKGVDLGFDDDINDFITN